MKRIINISLGALIIVFCYTNSVYSQKNQKTLSKNEKLSIIRKTIDLLNENYVFPEKVAEIEKSILNKFNTKSYESLISLQDFLDTLNNDLEKEAGDKHVNISFGPDRVSQIIKEKENQGEIVTLTKEWTERLKYENFRLRKVEWLDGNIGYFRFLNFTDLQVAKESIVGAMNFISNSNAIIIDLRDNGGGNSETLNFILSYFLQDGLKIGEFHYRKNNRIEEIKIPQSSDVKKIPDNVPVYILVSHKTSSAAEGMAAVLQGFGRAVIVGERTKGEGNPGELFVINEQLYVMIPTAISISAFPGKQSIEGIGVTPDIVISPEKSFDKAMLEICKAMAQNVTDKELKLIYEWQIPVWEYNINPTPIPADMQAKITGKYIEGRQLIIETGNYYYVNKDGQKTRLAYYGNNVFGMDGRQFLRIRIPGNESPVSYFEFFWDDGVVERINRVN